MLMIDDGVFPIDRQERSPSSIAFYQTMVRSSIHVQRDVVECNQPKAL
ncbi:hypothetical protein ACQ4M4_12575 [Leptolyngbya sp. AN02str]